MTDGERTHLVNPTLVGTYLGSLWLYLLGQVNLVEPSQVMETSKRPGPNLEATLPLGSSRKHLYLHETTSRAEA